MQHFLPHIFSEAEPHVLNDLKAALLQHFSEFTVHEATCVLLLPELQSAYKKHHSAETAVLKIMSDILQAAYIAAM